jgi:glycosyltransferase involved in cell wall biosynthesis
MTAYNREKYIAEAIESVLASTFTDFELIIVNDCSKDRTVEIARRYESDPRVRVHLNEKNLGDYPNRNRAASLASGKYLKYVDADDYIYPHGLEIIVGMMERFPGAGLGLASFEGDPKQPFPFQLSPLEAYRRHYFQSPIFHRAPLSSLIWKEAFDAVGGFSGRRWFGDFELWHLLAASYPVLLMPDGIVWYREHADQEMQNNRLNPMVNFAYYGVALNFLLKPECPLLQEEKTIAAQSVKRQQARTVLRTLWNRQLRIASEMLKQSGLTIPGLFFAAVSRRRRPGR